MFFISVSLYRHALNGLLSEFPLGTAQSGILSAGILYVVTTGFFYQEYLKSTDIEYTVQSAA
jgi:hypothetical protein